MNIEMTVVYCANCHLPFAMTDNLIDRLRNNHNSFFCPMGHGNSFPEKTKEEKLRQQLREKETLLANRDAQLKSLQESLAQKTVKRTKKAKKS